jgi:ABC-type multidrug transport system fused ATPase/permease subunit
MNTVRDYLQFVRPYWKMVLITILIGIVKFGIPLTLPLILKYVVDDLLLASIPNEVKVERLLWLMSGSFIVFIVLRGPIEYYRQYYAQIIGSKVLYDVRDKLYEHMQKLSLRYYHNHKVGEIISRVINDVEQTKTFVITGLMNIWLDMVTLFIAVGIMMFIDVKLTLVAIAIFPLYGLAVKYFYQRLRSLTKDRSQALAELQGHLHERVQGISVVRSFVQEDVEQERFQKRNGRFLDRAIAHTRWNAKTFAVVNTLTDIAPLLVIWYAAYHVIQETMTIGTLVAFYGYLERLYSPLRRLVNSSTTLTQSIASIDRVMEFMNEPYDLKDEPDAKNFGSVKGDIQINHIFFRFEDEGEWILKDLSLNVKAGQTVALVGMSGGGKSSLISLIPRFYDVQAGNIRIDGEDIKKVTLKSLRTQIGMVLQDTFLFSGTVLENIRMGKADATMEEVMASAQAAHAHGFINDLSHGYDTEIGEKGVKLSGGQRQRVALARVFLKNPRILILDEATSALDLESEQLIQQALDRLVKDRTTLIVAHRLSTITHADQIVLIENGEIHEQGTHLELMAKQGAYYRLFNVQNLEVTVKS